MPSKPLRPCGHPGCPALVQVGKCPEHSKDNRQYDKRRGSSTERGYGARHQRIREVVRREEPLCRECLSNNITTASSEMDHIDGNSMNTRRDNLQMLCKTCHSRKTIREQGGFGNGRRQ
jgi:5-methylcytosine-specific restriction protein A